MTEAEIETALESLVGTMVISGFTVTEETLESCRAILEGKDDVDEVVAEIIKKHRVTAKESNKKNDAS